MIKNTAKSVQLHLNGHTYYKKDTNNGKVYWRCILFKTGQCGATAITCQTRNGVKVIKEGVHGHSGSESDEHGSEEESDTNEPCESDYASDDHGVSDMTDEDQSDDSSSEESEREGKQWEFWEEETDVEDTEEDEEMEAEMEELEESDVDSEEGSDDGAENLVSEVESFLMDKLKLHRQALRNLSADSEAVRQAILKEANKDFICFLCEICRNLLNGYFNLERNEKNILKLFKDDVRALADEDIRWTDKKESLVECASDKFIPVLLNILLPHLS